jgi:hypothetical protein
MLSLAKNSADSISREGLRALSHAAHAANRLAHSLTGPDRACAFSLKSSILNVLILCEGAVRINGKHDNIVGLDIILSEPPSRLHCPVSSLSPEAQAIVRRQPKSIPAMAPLSARLNEDQLRSIEDHFSRGGDKRRVN